MPRSYASAVVAADPDTVWGFLRDFNGAPQFIELVAASEITGGGPADQVGAQRVLTLGDGGVVKETLVALDDAARSYTYHLTEGPFPFTRYYSTIRVTPVTDGGHSFVEWWSTYDCEAADAKAMDDLLAGGLYAGGLAAVKARFAS